MKDGTRSVVLLVISNLEYGGAQRQVIELANHLDPTRYDVHVCVLTGYVPLASALRDRDRRLHVIRKRFKFDATVIPRLAMLCRRLGVDVVYGFLFDAEVAARVAGRLARVPVVIGSERNTDYTLKKRQLMVFAWTKGCVDRIVANSSAGAAFHRRVLGHDAGLYRVVHNGVDVTRFRPGDGAAVRREIGVGAGESVVGMFGSLKAQKNQPLLLAAAKIVLERVPTARFVFVGDELFGGMHGSDAYARGVHALVDALGLRARCLFLGNRDDVERVYPACDVTVLPSLFEGTPNVLLESMACGVPVVATDVSDNRYLVPEGEVGHVVPCGDEAALADRICGLLLDDARRAAMGRAARSWMEREFSPARLAEKTAAVFDEALATRRALGSATVSGGRIGTQVS